MSKKKLFDLQKIRSLANEILDRAPHPHGEWQETLADHARHTGTGARQRIKLVAKGLIKELHASASAAKNKGKRIVRKTEAHVVMLASHKLHEFAQKLEQKANALK
ncbi:MAG: hypothetical protein ACAH12_01820 [Methylophilaceae bacterium]